MQVVRNRKIWVVGIVFRYCLCNLSFCSAVIILIVNRNLMSKLAFILRLFSKKTFFFRILICYLHASSYVTMVNHVTKFRNILVNLGSRKIFFFFLLPIRKFFNVFFFVSRNVLAFSGRLVSVYTRRRNFYDLENGRVECSK